MATPNTYAAVTSTTVDANHPYYLHPSDNPGMLLTTVTLTESNYSQWSRSMMIALSSKLKLGFVDGSYALPAANSPLLIHWNRCNHMVISWLLNSVSPEIRNSIVYMNSAHLIWQDLHTRYTQSNLPKLFSLRKDIAQLSQGSMSIAAYYTRYRALNDELESLATRPRCTCGHCTCNVNVNTDSFDSTIQLTQFLMGLGDQFTSIRGQILLMKPVPSLSQCYSMLLQEENQRDVSSQSILTTSNVAMNVVKSGGPNPVFGSKPSPTPRKGPDTSLYCDYCHLTGHTREKCFCLVGYPAWHKFYGKPKPKPKTARSNNVAQGSTDACKLEGFLGASFTPPAEPPQDSSLNCGLSDAQYKNLVQMLQSGMKSSAATSTPAQTWSTANTVHFAGNFQPALDIESNTHWILDSGATDHITSCFNLLHNPQLCNSMLHLPNGQSALVTHFGDVSLTPDITLHHVLCVPSFSYNLLSIPKSLHNIHAVINFSATTCTLQDPTWKRGLEIGRASNGLYLLHSAQVSSSSAFSVGFNCNNLHHSKLWHARMGHVPSAVLKLLPVLSNSCELPPCDVCHMAKQSKLSFPTSNSSSSELFDLVHADVWGPYRTKTHGNCSHFLTILEDITTRNLLIHISQKLMSHRIVTDVTVGDVKGTCL
nr:PREDICTED: uncharacterized protein LOC108194418 [Daucus carota subsp. sativus]